MEAKKSKAEKAEKPRIAVTSRMREETIKLAKKKMKNLHPAVTLSEYIDIATYDFSTR